MDTLEACGLAMESHGIWIHEHQMYLKSERLHLTIAAAPGNVLPRAVITVTQSSHLHIQLCPSLLVSEYSKIHFGVHKISRFRGISL